MWPEVEYHVWCLWHDTSVRQHYKREHEQTPLWYDWKIVEICKPPCILVTSVIIFDSLKYGNFYTEPWQSGSYWIQVIELYTCNLLKVLWDFRILLQNQTKKGWELQGANILPFRKNYFKLYAVFHLKLDHRPRPHPHPLYFWPILWEREQAQRHLRYWQVAATLMLNSEMVTHHNKNCIFIIVCQFLTNKTKYLQ